jgi:hypothetical protein
MAKSDEIRSSQDIMTAFDPSQAASAIEPFLQAGNKWIESWMAVGSELLEFGRTRLDRSIEVGKAMARTSTFDQAMDLQADYARSALRDYVSEASKLADLSTRAMFEGFRTWQGAARTEVATRRAAE